MGWHLYQEGMKFQWSFKLSYDDLKSFQDLSNDNNPIHHDNKFAESKGFRAPLIYGMLLATQISRLIGSELPDIHSILTGMKINFFKPAFPDEDLMFHAQLKSKSDATHALHFKFYIERESKKIAKGSVDALWQS